MRSEWRESLKPGDQVEYWNAWYGQWRAVPVIKVERHSSGRVACVFLEAYPRTENQQACVWLTPKMRPVGGW